MKDVYTGTGPNKKCDICPTSEQHDAEYDAPTIHGPWANMCADHYATHASTHASAVGYRLLWGDGPERRRPENTNPRDAQQMEELRQSKRDLMAAIEAGDYDLAEDIIGDGDISEWL